MPASSSALDATNRLGNLTLRVTAPGGLQKTIGFAGATCRVGSGQGSTLRIKAPRVQESHCIILRGEKQTVVRSLAEETWLNGQPLSEATLKVGDRLTIAALEIEVIEDERAGRPAGDASSPSAGRRERNEDGDSGWRDALAQLQSTRDEWAEQRRQWQAEVNLVQSRAADQYQQIDSQLARLNQSISGLLERQQQVEQQQSAAQRELQQRQSDLAARAESLSAALEETRGEREAWQGELAQWKSERRDDAAAWLGRLAEMEERLNATSADSPAADGDGRRDSSPPAAPETPDTHILDINSEQDVADWPLVEDMEAEAAPAVDDADTRETSTESGGEESREPQLAAEPVADAPVPSPAAQQAGQDAAAWLNQLDRLEDDPQSDEATLFLQSGFNSPEFTDDQDESRPPDEPAATAPFVESSSTLLMTAAEFSAGNFGQETDDGQRDDGPTDDDDSFNTESLSTESLSTELFDGELFNGDSLNTESLSTELFDGELFNGEPQKSEARDGRLEPDETSTVLCESGDLEAAMGAAPAGHAMDEASTTLLDPEGGQPGVFAEPAEPDRFEPQGMGEDVSGRAPIDTTMLFEQMGLTQPENESDALESPLNQGPQEFPTAPVQNQPQDTIDPVTPPSPPAAEPLHEDDGPSIEEYMAHLLSRSGAESGASYTPAYTADEPVETPAAPAVAAAPISPDEPYEPRATAPERSRDMSALRELANENARTAIDTHARKSQAGVIKGKLAIALVALFFSFILMFFSSAGVTVYLLSLAALAVAVFFGARYLLLSGRLCAAEEAAEALPQPTSAGTAGPAPRG